MGAIRLNTKFLALIVALFIVAVAASVAYTSESQTRIMEERLHEQAEMLTLQMKATWNFMAENEERFESSEYSSITGSYQGLHCAIIGRTIGIRFTNSTDYVTRYVNFSPRNVDDEPDDFESAALEAFYSGSGITEYYGIAQYEGRTVYRYLSAMEVSEACLECHGSPEGTVDVTGNEREGWQEGEVGGAISIIIPAEDFLRAKRDAVVGNAAFTVLLLVALLLVVYVALKVLVTGPLNKLQKGLADVESGDLDVELPPSSSSCEMNNLVGQFNRMTSELASLYGGLESQVEERTIQLRDINDRLQEANALLADENRYKTDFLSMISHELRTPLTSIIALSDMLKRRGGQDGPESEICQEIEANSRVLLCMINDILEMSRLDAGKTTLSVEPVDLCDLVGLVSSTMAPVARQAKVGLSCSIQKHTPILEADFEKVRHILENLIGNAVKFTSEGGSVRLDAGWDEEADEVWLTVSDTGIGIAAKDQDRIFEAFAQVDSSISKKHYGTGLGLPLARQYAEMHGGTISLKSREGEGSAFTVRLPVKQSKGE